MHKNREPAAVLGIVRAVICKNNYLQNIICNKLFAKKNYDFSASNKANCLSVVNVCGTLMGYMSEKNARRDMHVIGDVRAHFSHICNSFLASN
jgi:hypothetical protein